MRAVARLSVLVLVFSGLVPGLGGSCSPSTPSRTPVPLSLQLVTRQSCGVLSGLDYDTSCLAALYVRVLDARRQQIHEECHVLDARPGELQEIVRGSPLVTFAGLSANQTVTFEVRGLHDVLETGSSTENPCARTVSDDHWLFWGESAPVDLSSYQGKEGDVIAVVIDCRDCTFDCGDQECFGCGGLGVADCPASFPPSFCVPTGACDRTCEADANCFDGARQCVTGRCDVADVDGALCAPCGGDVGCGEGLACVARSTNGPGFCAPTCPDTPCPSGTRCNRLGNGLVLLP